MLWTIAMALIIFWAVGMIASITLGGFIHVFLVLAAIAILIRIIRGNRLGSRW